MGFDPWVGKILWRRAWQPTPVFLPEESHGERSVAGYSPWGRKESDMTEELTLHYPSKQHWFYKALIFLCLLGPPGSRGWHDVRRDVVYLLLMKKTGEAAGLGRESLQTVVQTWYLWKGRGRGKEIWQESLTAGRRSDKSWAKPLGSLGTLLCWRSPRWAELASVYSALSD